MLPSGIAVGLAQATDRARCQSVVCLRGASLILAANVDLEERAAIARCIPFDAGRAIKITIVQQQGSFGLSAVSSQVDTSEAMEDRFRPIRRQHKYRPTAEWGIGAVLPVTSFFGRTVQVARRRVDNDWCLRKGAVRVSRKRVQYGIIPAIRRKPEHHAAARTAALAVSPAAGGCCSVKIACCVCEQSSFRYTAVGATRYVVLTERVENVIRIFAV